MCRRHGPLSLSGGSKGPGRFCPARSNASAALPPQLGSLALPPHELASARAQKQVRRSAFNHQAARAAALAIGVPPPIAEPSGGNERREGDAQGQEGEGGDGDDDEEEVSREHAV